MCDIRRISGNKDDLGFATIDNTINTMHINEYVCLEYF